MLGFHTLNYKVVGFNCQLVLSLNPDLTFGEFILLYGIGKLYNYLAIIYTYQ